MTHTHPTPSAPLATFLRRLGAEEELLAAAVEKAEEVSAALRRGALPEVTRLGAEQERLAADLRAASAARLDAAHELAARLGTPAAGLTLGALADRLPADDAAPVRAARARLADLASRLTAIQTRNANLLAHLRSFFRDVLSHLTPDDAHARYGPSGRLLPGALSPRRGTS